MNIVVNMGSAKLCGVDQRAPPIFGRVAIMSGIGPHSSWRFFASCVFCLNCLVSRVTAGLMGSMK